MWEVSFDIKYRSFLNLILQFAFWKSLSNSSLKAKAQNTDLFFYFGLSNASLVTFVWQTPCPSVCGSLRAPIAPRLCQPSVFKHQILQQWENICLFMWASVPQQCAIVSNLVSHQKPLITDAPSAVQIGLSASSAPSCTLKGALLVRVTSFNNKLLFWSQSHKANSWKKKKKKKRPLEEQTWVNKYLPFVDFTQALQELSLPDFLWWKMEQKQSLTQVCEK